jgi:hypothetical protein
MMVPSSQTAAAGPMRAGRRYLLRHDGAFLAAYARVRGKSAYAPRMALNAPRRPTLTPWLSRHPSKRGPEGKQVMKMVQKKSCKTC